MNTLIKIFSFLLFLSPLFPQQLYEEQIMPFDGLDSDHFALQLQSAIVFFLYQAFATVTIQKILYTSID